MAGLFPSKFMGSVPKTGEQEGSRNPIVHAVFYFSLSGWIWFATEGDAYEDDICFFGYVVGLAREWGYFCLSELESIDINGIKVGRAEDHLPRPLSTCLRHYGIAEN